MKNNTKIRSPESIKVFTKTIKKVFNYLNTDINNYKTIDKNKIDYKELVNLVHYKHICFINHICKYIFEINIPNTIESKPVNYNYEIKKEEQAKDFISCNELNILYSNSNDKEKLILLLLMSTGIRISGLANIHDINYENNTFKTIEKGNKEITYNIKSSLIIDLLKKTKFFNKKKHPATISNIIINLRKKCNLGPNIHCHAFRHTYARLLLANGVSLLDVSKLLNHSNSLITEKIYLTETMIDVQNRVNLPFNNIIEDKIIPDIWIDLKNNPITN